jgi:hypothetical protein
MEIHGDILGVVRAFAQPRMQFVNEFAEANKALRENNIQYSQSLHDAVKAKLATSDAPQVFEAFSRYIQATLAQHNAWQDILNERESTNSFTQALIQFEEMEELLVTAVYGPVIMD